MSRNRFSVVSLLAILVLGSSLVAGCAGSSTTAEAAPESTAAAAPVIDVPVVKAVVGDIEAGL
jgi:uncharacterized lipoprotein YajG